MLLLKLTACLDHAHDKLLRSIHNAALHKQALQILNNTAHAARLPLRLLKRFGEVVAHLGGGLGYLGLVLPLQGYALLFLLVVAVYLGVDLSLCSGRIGKCPYVSAVAEIAERAKAVAPARRVKVRVNISQYGQQLLGACYLAVYLAGVGTTSDGAKAGFLHLVHDTRQRLHAGLRLLYLSLTLTLGGNGFSRVLGFFAFPVALGSLVGFVSGGVQLALGFGGIRQTRLQPVGLRCIPLVAGSAALAHQRHVGVLYLGFQLCGLAKGFV